MSPFSNPLIPSALSRPHITCRREAVEMRTDKAEQSRSTISQDNDRLLHMLKEAEDARSTIEQARAETEQKNLTIVGEVSLGWRFWA